MCRSSSQKSWPDMTLPHLHKQHSYSAQNSTSEDAPKYPHRFTLRWIQGQACFPCLGAVCQITWLSLLYFIWGGVSCPVWNLSGNDSAWRVFRLSRYVTVLNSEKGTRNKSCLKVKNKQTEISLWLDFDKVKKRKWNKYRISTSQQHCLQSNRKFC